MASIQNVKVKDLKRAEYNPPNREKAISGLIKSIEEVGLIVPILIDKKNNLVDGHRRVAAYGKLGLEEIPAIVVNGERETIFSHVNAHQQRFSGNQQLHIYLTNKTACGDKARGWLEQCEETLGLPLLKKMAKDGYSMATYRLAKNIAVEADRDTPAVIRKIVKWLMHFNSMGLTKKALEAGTPAGRIMEAVEKHKAIRPTFAVAK